MKLLQQFFYKAFVERDIRYLFYERWSRLVGRLTTRLSMWIYGDRLQFGRNCKVWGSIRFLIQGPGSIRIGDDFHCVSSRQRSFITLFTPCHFTVIGYGIIEIGNHVGLNGVTIVSRCKVSIGNNVMIAPNTIIVDHDGHPLWPPSDRWYGKGAEEEVVIEDDVWIGMNSIILKGVRIGHGSIIAAGSVVAKNVPANCVFGGNPARKIRDLGPVNESTATQMHVPPTDAGIQERSES